MWRKKNMKGKRVSFANPLVQLLGESAVDVDVYLYNSHPALNMQAPEWIDPMLEEFLISPSYVGHQSKESRIRDMFEATTGWKPISSPIGIGAAEEEPDEDQLQATQDTLVASTNVAPVDLAFNNLDTLVCIDDVSS
jgi:hypothetical protein